MKPATWGRIVLPVQNHSTNTRRIYEYAKSQPVLAERQSVPGAGFIGDHHLLQKFDAFVSVSVMASFAVSDVP
jgi:hypothetical protein